MLERPPSPTTVLDLILREMQALTIASSLPVIRAVAKASWRLKLFQAEKQAKWGSHDQGIPFFVDSISFMDLYEYSKVMGTAPDRLLNNFVSSPFVLSPL